MSFVILFVLVIVCLIFSSTTSHIPLCPTHLHPRSLLRSFRWIVLLHPIEFHHRRPLFLLPQSRHWGGGPLLVVGWPPPSLPCRSSWFVFFCPRVTGRESTNSSSLLVADNCDLRANQRPDGSTPTQSRPQYPAH